MNICLVNLLDNNVHLSMEPANLCACGIFGRNHYDVQDDMTYDIQRGYGHLLFLLWIQFSNSWGSLLVLHPNWKMLVWCSLIYWNVFFFNDCCLSFKDVFFASILLLVLFWSYVFLKGRFNMHKCKFIKSKPPPIALKLKRNRVRVR